MTELNNFDKQRIENAIWILEYYEEEICKIAKELEHNGFECDDTFYVLKDVREKLIG